MERIYWFLARRCKGVCGIWEIPFLALCKRSVLQGQTNVKVWVLLTYFYTSWDGFWKGKGRSGGSVAAPLLLLGLLFAFSASFFSLSAPSSEGGRICHHLTAHAHFVSEHSVGRCFTLFACRGDRYALMAWFAWLAFVYTTRLWDFGRGWRVRCVMWHGTTWHLHCIYSLLSLQRSWT
jgi:hypothetical protein